MLVPQLREPGVNGYPSTATPMSLALCVSGVVICQRVHAEGCRGVVVFPRCLYTGVRFLDLKPHP